MFSFILLNGQSSSKLIGCYWNGTAEVTRHLNLSNGAFTNLANVSGVSGIIQGESTYDETNKRYFFYSTAGIALIDAPSGTLISMLTPTPHLYGIEYDLNTSCLLGTNFIGSVWSFVSFNPLNGLTTTINTLAGVSGFAQGESTFDATGSRYFMRTTNGIVIINSTSGGVQNTINNTTFKGMQYNSNTSELIGTFWNGSAEIYATMNIATGAVTNVATLPGVTSIVQGESTFDVVGNRYFIRTNLGVTVINALTGAILSSVPGLPDIGSIEYIGNVDPCGSFVYSLPAQINATSGSSALFSIASNTILSYQWQSNPAGFGWMNVVNNSNYSGATSSALTVSSLSLQNHLQPFRVIISSGVCDDTSNVSVINISDTCVVTIYDTLLVGNGAKLSDPDISPLIVYPNPSTNLLNVENNDVISWSDYSIEISNNIGEIVFIQKVNQKHIEIDVSRFKGIYFIQARDKNNKTIEAKKIVIQ